MEAEIKSLESKVAQAAALCQRLRTENHELRQELAAALNEKKMLSNKVAATLASIERVVHKIPGEPDA